MLKSDGLVVYRQVKGGVIQMLEHNLKLSHADGHYYHKDVANPDGSVTRRRVISARGFELIGAIAGVTFVKPPRVADENGIEVDNPIIRRSGGTVSFVRIREMLIGRARNGNLRAIDLSLSYDVESGLATQMMDAWMEGGNPAWAYLCNEGHASAHMAESAFKGAIGIGGGAFLVYDMRDRLVRKILRDHLSWSMLADRTAATIVERNLMRRFLGFSDVGEDETVRFCSWPSADVEWDKIRFADGSVIVDALPVSPERFDEKAEEVEAEESVPRDQDVRALIKEEVRKIGSAQKARAIGKDVCKQYGIRWGSIGTTDNQEFLLAIFTALRNNAREGDQK